MTNNHVRPGEQQARSATIEREGDCMSAQPGPEPIAIVEVGGASRFDVEAAELEWARLLEGPAGARALGPRLARGSRRLSTFPDESSWEVLEREPGAPRGACRARGESSAAASTCA